MRLNNVRTAAAAALVMVSSAASAATYCKTGAVGDDPTVNVPTNGVSQRTSDVRYSSGTAPNQYGPVNADDCYGVVSGNDSDTDSPSSNIVNVNSFNWDTGWLQAAKDDGTSASVAGVSWTVTTDVSASEWTLTGTGAAIPGWFDFIFVLKGSPGFAAYYFDDVFFSGSSPGSGEAAGTYTLTVKNNGGNIAGLSHLSVYARGSDCQTNCDGPDLGGNVPEPVSLALVGAALLGARFAARRRS